MPITEELNNIRKFESAGFSHEQSETLTDVIEESIAKSHQGLRDFIHNEITNLELRIKASQADLLMKIFAIVAGCSSLTIAILKIFP